MPALKASSRYAEIKSITDRNVPMPKILVSDRAQIVMPITHVRSDHIPVLTQRVEKLCRNDRRLVVQMLENHVFLLCNPLVLLSVFREAQMRDTRS